MRLGRIIVHRCRSLIRRSRTDEDLQRELDFHIDQLVKERIAEGMSESEARRTARRQFGSLDVTKEQCRDARGITLVETTLQDLKHSLHMFAKSKAFTATVVAALALGIGGNTAIFSIVNAVLLKPAPFPDPDRLVMFLNTNPLGTAASPAKFQHWRSQSTVQDAAAFRTGVVNYTGGETPEQLNWAQVSADYFKLFGAPLVLGRAFSREEDLPIGPKVAIISHSLWTRRFASDPNVIGKHIFLSAEAYVVVGVVGPAFDVREFGPAPEVWTAFQLDPNTSDQGHYFQAAGRLKTGVTLDQAKAELQKSAAGYREKIPNAIGPAAAGFTVELFQEAFVGNVRQTLLVLLGAVSFVLLIACANVANLLLMRATGRKREIAIRASLGAGRARIVRQLLTESVVLSLAGGALGIVVGSLGVRALLAVNTAGLPRVGDNGAFVVFDWTVLGVTLLVSLGTGILFGLIPALQGSRTDLHSSLKESGGRIGVGLRQNRLRSLLVVVEIGLAVILLVGSALFIRAQMALAAVDPGFQTTNVLTMRMSLTGPEFLRSAGLDQAVREGVERIRSLPGVVSAAAVCCLPLQAGPSGPFRIMGRPLTGGPYHGGAGWASISSGYFDVFRIPIKRGRAFSDRDNASAPPVVIINESMAREYWAQGDDPLEARLLIAKGLMKEFDDEPERQIIGIAADVRDRELNIEPEPRMYVPQAQVPDALNASGVRRSPIAWVIRGEVAPSSLSGAIQEQLRQVTGLPVSDIQTMDNIVSLSTSRQRFNMLLMTVFAGAAMVLAAIGIYGLMAYSIEQRTPEIGIRLALGADVAAIKRMIVLQGMRLTLIGVIVGVLFAFNLTKFIGGFLFGVGPWDLATFVTIPVVLSAVALLAVWLPARRASRINPMEALRYE